MPTKTVMLAQGHTLALDRRCDVVLLWTPTSFLTSTLTLAITHVESWDLVIR